MNLANRIRETFASLAERDYRLLWTGSLMATTSFLTTFYLAPIVAYEITGSYAASGFAQAGMIAQVVFGPFSGVIADRYRKKPLVLASQIIPAVIVVVTGVLIVSDLITTPLLFVSTFLVGAGFSMMGPARQAWIAGLVPRELLPNAVALQNMSINIATVFGPALFAILFVAIGLDSGILYMLVAVPLVIAVPLTLTISGAGRATPPEQRKSMTTEIAAGLRYITSRPKLRSLWLFWMLIVVTGFGLQTLVPGLLDQEFGRSENEALIIGTIWGVTALPVNLMVGRSGGQSTLALAIAAVLGRRPGRRHLAHRLGARVWSAADRLCLRRWGSIRCDAAQPDDRHVQHPSGVLRPGDELDLRRDRPARHSGAGLGYRRRCPGRS